MIRIQTYEKISLSHFYRSFNSNSDQDETRDNLIETRHWASWIGRGQSDSPLG